MRTNGDSTPEPIDRRRLFLFIGLASVVWVVCLFLAAGTWAWFRGWLFFAVILGTRISSIIYLRRVNPEVIAAQVNRHRGTKHWDRILIGMLYPTLMAVPILAALDDGRYHWSHVPWWICGIGYVLLIVGMAGATWALSVNQFFERTVRIQTDRGHHVVDNGPYALVRHPGYMSGFLVLIGMPLCLGSVWAIIPAILSCLLLVVRTVLEDRTLRKELAGYEEYTQRVRFKLVPGVF